MPLYDNVHIDRDKLPVSQQVKDKLANTVFQSKSLNCLYDDIFITEQNTLERDSYSSFIERINHKHETLDYTGILNFYELVDDVWYEFDAKFFDGKLIVITQIFE